MKYFSILKSTPLKFTVSAIFAAAVVACGGGSSSSPSVSYLPNSEGKVVNDYIYAAIATLDLNDDGVCGNGEPQVTTDRTGQYVFPGLGLHTVCVTGGYNVATQQPFVGELKAPPGFSVATPLTTLMTTQLPAKPTPAQIEATQAKIAGQLGLSATDISKDPVASIATNPKIEQTNAAIQVMLQTAAKSVAAFAGVSTPATTASAADKVNYKAALDAIYTKAVEAVASTLLTSTTAIDLTSKANDTTNTSFVQAALKKTIEEVKTSVSSSTSTVAAALSSVSTTAIASIGNTSSTNAAAAVANNVAAVVQSVAQVAVTSDPDATRAALVAAATVAQSNTTIANAVEALKTAAPQLLVASAKDASAEIAAVAEIILPKASAVNNTAVVLDQAAVTTVTSKLQEAAKATGTTLTNVTSIVEKIVAVVEVPPPAPEKINLETVVVPVVKPLPAPVPNEQTITGGAG